MSPYLYAGATLALAGIVDQQQRLLSAAPLYRNLPTHPQGIFACRTCRAIIRNKLGHWLDQQAPSRWRTPSSVAPSDPYWMAA